MGYVVDHLLACQKDYDRRDLHPIVAWDLLGARAWADNCGKLARVVADLPDEQAIGYLKATRDGVPAGLIGTDIRHQMDVIIDPIAKDQRGYISIDHPGTRRIEDGTHDGKWIDDLRPRYTRELGVNNVMSAISRDERKNKFDHQRSIVETDEQWIARRRAWLSRYHPDIWVIRGGYHGLYHAPTAPHGVTALVCRLGEFLEMDHLEERPDDHLRFVS